MLGTPLSHQRIEAVEGQVAIAVDSGEVQAGLGFQCSHLFADFAGSDDALPLAGAHRHDLDALAVGQFEIPPEGAVYVVADTGSLGAQELGFGHMAQHGNRGQGCIRQGQVHQAALAGSGSLALGGQHPQRGGLAADDVPGGQHMVDGAVGAGEPGIAHGAVHGVVHRGGAVVVAGDGHHDEVVAVAAEAVVRQPTDGGEVGGEDAGVGAWGGGQCGDQLAAFGGAEIDLDRPLSLIEPLPVQRLAVGGERPAVVVDPSADGVEADHVGAVLGQGHAPRRAGHKGRPLHHPHSRQHAAHGQAFSRGRTSAPKRAIWSMYSDASRDRKKRNSTEVPSS